MEDDHVVGHVFEPLDHRTFSGAVGYPLAAITTLTVAMSDHSGSAPSITSTKSDVTRGDEEPGWAYLSIENGGIDYATTGGHIDHLVPLLEQVKQAVISGEVSLEVDYEKSVTYLEDVIATGR